MHIPKHYFHDRFVLLLLTINTFLAAAITVLILLRLDTGGTGAYFVQYRENLGLNAYTLGNITGILSFIVFAVFVLGFHTLVSMRVYSTQRNISLTVLAFGTLLLGLALIVSNALLLLL